MFKRRKDRSLKSEKYDCASDYYAAVRSSIKEKADHNKFESQITFFSVICFSLAAPLFVTLGSGPFFAKMVPATLSVMAAAATSWLQLRKPQRLWSIYRRAQRELEREKTAFDFTLSDYDECGDPERRLVQKVSDIAFAVHEQWEGLVPDADSLSASTSAPSSQEDREEK